MAGAPLSVLNLTGMGIFREVEVAEVPVAPEALAVVEEAVALVVVAAGGHF